METLTTLLTHLSIATNLEFIGHDPHHGSIPPFLMIHNDWYWQLQALVFTTICTYACLFTFSTVQKALYGFRRSLVSAEKAEQFFMKYDVPKHEIIKDDIYYKALDIVINWFRPEWKIHPVHFTDLRWYPWKTDTSAERPFTAWNIQGKKRFSALYSEIFTYCRTVIHRFKDGLSFNYDPITLHVKPSLVEIDDIDKVRTVFGVPKYCIFSEAMFFWPLFSHYHTHKRTPLLWNYESLNGGWHRLNAEYYSRKDQPTPLINIDWSMFDMYVYFSMWKDIIDRVKTYFCFCGSYCPAGEYDRPQTNPQRLHNLWDRITDMYFNFPCATTLGNVFKRMFAGMPSGIFCTQFYDSLYNGTMIVACLLALDIPVPDDLFIKLMGDDALFGILANLPVSAWADFLSAFAAEAKRRFNSNLSPTKCGMYLSIQGSKVLGYSNFNGWPSRPDEELLSRLLHPKSLRDTPGNLMARAIGIYYASCGSNKFRPICEHIFSELQSQGFQPSIKGLYALYDPIGIHLTEEDLAKFPSKTEVISRISGPSNRNPDLQSKYWDRYHFHFEAGIAECSQASAI
jgi:hypothetical protein